MRTTTITCDLCGCVLDEEHEAGVNYEAELARQLLNIDGADLHTACVDRICSRARVAVATLRDEASRQAGEPTVNQ